MEGFERCHAIDFLSVGAFETVTFRIGGHHLVDCIFTSFVQTSSNQRSMNVIVRSSDAIGLLRQFKRYFEGSDGIIGPVARIADIKD